ncbi:MAG: hypothetical protein JWQ96_3184, partial [Segetibacter sp.]|nr:hypothetical protein [Segetibacter sp.]
MVWLLLQTETVQNWLAKKVTARLSKDLKTEVSIRHVNFTFFNSMNLEGTMIKDLNKDTLLYADKLKLRITDWFFFKDELVLKYIGLEDAHINTYRRDTIWNYQFLADYFSPKKTTKEKKPSTLKLNLDKLDLKNISYVQNDVWIGTKTTLKFSNLQLDADNMDFNENNMRIREIELENPFYAVREFEGIRAKRPKKVRAANDTSPYFNPGGIRLSIGRLSIKNGRFINQRESDRPTLTYFDPLNLKFEKINGTLSDVSFFKDTIKAKVDLVTKERSGFEVRELKANFKLTPQILEFASLSLVTPKSKLQNYLAFKFKDFNEDFKDFIHQVTMDARFANAQINSDDLAYFAPQLKTLKKNISISGNGYGTLDNLTAKKLFVRTGNNTTLSGNASIVGLPEMQTAVIHFEGDAATSYRDAVLFAPALRDVQIPSVSSLGNIRFKGNFNGTLSKFTTAGNFTTNLGAFTTNLSLAFPENASTSYEGTFVTPRFNVGKFLVVKNLGDISFNGKIKGVGLTLNTLRTSVTGNIQQVLFQDYNYKKIAVEGTFQRKQFDGTVKIDDPNLNFITTVQIDFRNRDPKFNVLGDLANSNFQKLKFIDRQLEISGLFDLNFTGRNIDQFLGSVKVYNANLLQDSVRLNFDSLSLQSRYEQGRRTLSLSSNEFNARIEGEYNILDLPTGFQAFLHKYYPAYIAAPKRTVKDQRFDFEVITRNIQGYTQLLDKNLRGFSNSTISGSINTIDTIFQINANIPAFAYNQYRFNNIVLN